MGQPKEGEFIVVRLGRDEVPFAPNELALSARGKTATTTAARSAPAKKVTRAAAKKTTRAKAAAPAKAAPAKATPAKATPAKAAPVKAAAAKPAPAKAAPARTGTRRSSKRSRRGQQALTVTLRFADGTWTVEAQRGSRRLARASALRPGAVKAFAEYVDEPAVRDAISEIVESGRTVAAERAAKLRAELEAAEASLREYEARRR
jgi:hypothetical protein